MKVEFRKLILLYSLSWLIPAAGFAQSAFALDQFPFARQLFTRDLESNAADIEIAGWILSSQGIDTMRFVAYDEQGGLVAGQQQVLNASSDTAFFDLTLRLEAGLTQYQLRLEGWQPDLGRWKIYHEAAEVLVGDVFYICGQSNAEARGSIWPDDLSPYMRSFTYEHGWNLINKSFPGQWGGRFARRWLDEQQVPVAIINRAVGAASW